MDIVHNAGMETIPANYITPEAFEALKKAVEARPGLTLDYELLTDYASLYDADEDEPCSHIAIDIYRGKRTYIGNLRAGTSPVGDDEFREILAEAGLSYDLDAEEMDDETDEETYNHDVVEYGCNGSPYYYRNEEDPRWLTIVFALLEPTHDIE